MNSYRFLVNCDKIVSDNIFTILAKSFSEAKKTIRKDVELCNPEWYSIFLVYTDDPTLRGELDHESNIRI